MKYKKLMLILILVSIFVFELAHRVDALNDKQEEKEKQFNQNENIVFLGDSLFDLYKTEFIYDDLPIVNSGVAGETATDILNDMENRVYRYNPTKLFILVGINDLYKYRTDYSKEEVVKKVTNNIDEIVRQTRKYRPKCKVYIISLLPINEEMFEHAYKDYDKYIINDINNYLSVNYLEDNMIKYIDAHSKLHDENGNLREEFTREGLHLNDFGYVKLTEILMKYIYQ